MSEGIAGVQPISRASLNRFLIDMYEIGQKKNDEQFNRVHDIQQTATDELKLQVNFISRLSLQLPSPFYGTVVWDSHAGAKADAGHTYHNAAAGKQRWC